MSEAAMVPPLTPEERAHVEGWLDLLEPVRIVNGHMVDPMKDPAQREAAIQKWGLTTLFSSVRMDATV